MRHTILTHAILASVNHTLVETKKGADFVLLNTSLECHKVTNYPFSILIWAAYTIDSLGAARSSCYRLVLVYILYIGYCVPIAFVLAHSVLVTLMTFPIYS